MFFKYFMGIGKANLMAIVESNALAAKGTHALAHEYLSLAHRNIERVTVVSRAMMACRMPTRVVLLQSRLIREAFSCFLDERNRLAEVTSSVVRETLAPTIGARCKANLSPSAFQLHA